MRAGLSQEALANRLGVRQGTVSTWEAGNAKPRAHRLNEIERILDLGPVGESVDASSSSAYGEWLIGARTRRGWTRRELAERSQVSEQQIWNIENGKTLNPRRQTRDRLSKALGEATPVETVEATEEDAVIPDVGTLTDFDPHDDEDVPDEPGLYVFYDISDRPVYVGESDSIKRRVGEHADKFWFKRPIVETAAYVRIADQRLRRQVEATMIRFLKSNAVINKRQVSR